MRIEVAKEGRMDMSGRGLIRAIQNNNMPLLDLLVRESVQNSLDAAKADVDCVKVDFGIGRFKTKELANVLEGISETLNHDYKGDEYPYMYIRDRGTEGLTGPLHFSDKNSTGKQNLLKLVYEIAKPQDGKEAGGSWGYGKTIYYRVGIGLVLYYSRIKNPAGSYESRLAACLIEDENRADALLRKKELNSSRGLAWWGQEYTYNSGGRTERGTIPETEENVIRNILSIFGFPVFSGNETGTAVIIPFINEQKLLTNNIPHDSEYKLPWVDSIDEYLRIAVQRWYIGRLNNTLYKKINKQPWLSVTVNGEGLGNDDLRPTFKEIQKLYNMALSCEEREDGDYYCQPIRLREFFEDTVSGYVAYKSFTKGELGMLPPENDPDPFICVKNENGEDDYKNGDIILTYFRKPGMAVTYDTAGEWVNKIRANNEGSGTYLMVVFVLKSSNRFKNSAIVDFETIEEYFRDSERADHTAWYDIAVNDVNPRFLNKIQKQIGKKVTDTYRKPEEKTEEKSSSLSKMFGDFLLPPQGFGRRASTKAPKTKPDPGSVIVKHKSISLKVDNNHLVRERDKLVLPVVITATRSIQDAVFSLEVVGDGRNIPVYQWYDRVGITEPFFIKSINVDEVQTDGIVGAKHLLIDGDKEGWTGATWSLQYIKTLSGVNSGMRISSSANSFKVTMKLTIAINDNMAQLGYQLSEGE